MIILNRQERRKFKELKRTDWLLEYLSSVYTFVQLGYHFAEVKKWHPHNQKLWHRMLVSMMTEAVKYTGIPSDAVMLVQSGPGIYAELLEGFVLPAQALKKRRLSPHAQAGITAGKAIANICNLPAERALFMQTANRFWDNLELRLKNNEVLLENYEIIAVAR